MIIGVIKGDDRSLDYSSYKSLWVQIIYTDLLVIWGPLGFRTLIGHKLRFNAEGILACRVISWV